MVVFFFFPWENDGSFTQIFAVITEIDFHLWTYNTDNKV